MTSRYQFYHSSFIIFEQFNTNFASDTLQSKLKVNFSEISFSLRFYLNSFLPSFCVHKPFFQFVKLSTFFQFLETITYCLMLQDFQKSIKMSLLLPTLITKKIQMGTQQSIYFWYPTWVTFFNFRMLSVVIRY